jgi:Cu(I)/Ag(I) efflux system membrane fusion protein
MKTSASIAKRCTCLALAALLLLAAACGKSPAKGKYYCPMHPNYVSDKPGDCPICNMRLVKKGGKGGPKAGSEAAPQGRRVLFYRHPMNPSITSPVPAKDEMGMDYVPVYSDEARAGAPGGIEGMARVDVGEQGRRLAGIQTAVAERQTLTSTTRAVGVVVADETRVRTVQTKVSGWVEKLYVNATGQPVRAGQPLLAIYSPQLLATQEEFLRARQTAERFSKSSLPEVRQGGEDLLTASRRRLELFDVPRGTIAQLERTGKAQRTVTLTAPASGYVTAKEVFEGQEVQPGMTLFTVTDLSRVWVEADFYQMESRALAIGQKADITLPNDPGVRLSGRVTLVYPMLDPQSRTLKARIEFANPGLLLKPGMYVDVIPDLETQTGVVVPDSAVLDTGVRQVVFVEKRTDQGAAFEPREVRVGSHGDGKALILQGVEAGERVAVAANFLLDSESRLRAAVAGMKPGGNQ